MNDQTAVAALSALANEHRLKAFRLLVRAGHDGLTAGAIAEWLAIAPSALSFHLAHLERAGLIRSQRRGRCIVYAFAADAMRDLLGFLTADCCQGRPELCGGLAEIVEVCG